MARPRNIRLAHVELALLLCGLSVPTIAPAQALTSLTKTVVEVGNDLFVLPGTWREQDRSNWIANEVELERYDSTRISLRTSEATAFLFFDEDRGEPSFIRAFYRMKEDALSGSSHWSCWATMQLTEDHAEEGYILWHEQDRCGQGLVGLYGIANGTVYELCLRSARWPEEDQQRMLIDIFLVKR
jgi:hypothetical protein